MWTMVWWYRLGLTPELSTRALWQPPVLSGGPVGRDIFGASRSIGDGNENLVYLSSRDFKRSLTCRKIFDVGPPALLPIWMKVCCGFLSPLKIHRLGRVWTRHFWVRLSILIYHLGDEQYACWWLQFKDKIVSPQRHEQQPKNPSQSWVSSVQLMNVFLFCKSFFFVFSCTCWPFKWPVYRRFRWKKV
jgi:hypothetical protein